MGTGTDAVDIKMIKDIVREIVTTRPGEIDCPECFMHLDSFADLILNGADAVAAMPQLQDHLEHCRLCREEFEALLDALRNLD